MFSSHTGQLDSASTGTCTHVHVVLDSIFINVKIVHVIIILYTGYRSLISWFNYW